MGRLFAGTAWDRPPSCEVCGKLASECVCPPRVVAPARIAPEAQTARIRIEKRPKGKMVTVVSHLDPSGNDLPALAAVLKAKCGTGGTAKDDVIELQGDHVSKVEAALAAIGYKVKRG